MRATLDNRAFADEFVRSMVKGGFVNGILGDTSEDFIQEQIHDWTEIFDRKHGQIHENYVSGNAFNLNAYCGWSLEDVVEYVKRCHYFPYEIEWKERTRWVMCKTAQDHPETSVLAYLSVAKRNTE